MTTLTVVGKRKSRVEGPLKVSGAAKYTADYVIPGTLWAKSLRSPFPHALIKRIDTSKAQALPGVRGIVTAKDFGGMRVGISLRDMTVMADEKVRFIGEKIAAVCAETPEIAEEAVNLIAVDYEELPAVFDPVKAMEAGAPILHANKKSYTGLLQPPHDNPNIRFSRTFSHGDIEKGFAESDRIFENTFNTTWALHGYLEPTACMVHATGDTVHVWASNSTPSSLRRNIVEFAKIPPENVVIHTTFIGGDFGGKRHPAEVIQCCALSRMTGRPVKMVMDYAEDILSTDPRHPTVTWIKTGIKKDGTINALQASMIFNGGAYGSFTPGGGIFLVEGVAGPYRIPNSKIDTFTVYTNTVPCGFMRGPGGTQAAFAGESNMDSIAKAIGMDPAEFRMKNVLRRGDVSATGHHWKDANVDDYLRKALDHSNYRSPKKPGVGRGIGMGDWHVGGGQTYVNITVRGDGRVAVQNSKPDLGTALLTAVAVIVAEELGVPIESIEADRMPYEEAMDDAGIGGSSGNKSVGITSIRAAKEIRANAIKAASQHLGWNEADLQYEKGKVVNTSTLKSVSIFELAKMNGGKLTGNATFGPREPLEAAVFAAVVAEVEVDEETGRIKVNKITSVHDAGTVINPLVFEGQIEGGIMQGLGYALMEEIKIEDGRPVTTTLGDYKLPTMLEIPQLKIVAVEDENPAEVYGPYGAKNIGESGIIGVAAAIANAVADASGIRISGLPLSAEKVYAALQLRGKKV